MNIRKLRLCVEATGTKETEDACGVALSRIFHTYSSNEAHEEKDADAGEDVSVHAPLDLAAFVPRATVVQHGFRLMAFEGKVRSSVFGPPFASGSSRRRVTSAQGRDRVQTERTDVWTGEGTWGGGMKREKKIDMYALPCVNKIASGKLLCSTGRSAQGSVMTQRGGMWEVRGDILYNICVYKWLIHIVV